MSSTRLSLFILREKLAGLEKSAAKWETMTGPNGKPYKALYKEFTTYVLREMGYKVRGTEAGLYLRDEKPIPEDHLIIMRNRGIVKGPGVPRRTPTVRGRRPNIDKMWEQLKEAVRKEAQRSADISDYIDDNDPDMTPDQVASMMSADVDVEYALYGTKAGRLWDKFFAALKSGNYTSQNQWEKWNSQERKWTLYGIYRDNWYDAALRSAGHSPY